jgi:hypothetical protein
VNQIRIEGNEFDGNPLLIRGDGILSPQNTTQVTVSGNTFWACGKNGISTTDPVGWSITGNNFWKNNDSDGGYDDIRIIGATFQPNGNVVSGNTFTMDVARTAKGYPIREVNAGFFPVANVYQSNGIVGAANYLGGILILNNAKYDGTLGGAAKLYANVVNVGMGDSPGLLLCAAGGTVAAGGTLDMAINTETFGGAPGGFAGNLSVSATRSNFPTQSRRTVYNTAAYGTTATFSSATSQDGSGGGSAFTLTMVSNGVVRFTDTSGSGSSIEVRMAFVGAKSLA